MGSRLGGHLVQGHVDAVGTILSPPPDLEVALDEWLAPYVVEKGSITVDGISLTVVGSGAPVVPGRHHPPYPRSNHPRPQDQQATGSTWRST